MITSSTRRPARLRLLCVALASAFIAPQVSAETINASGLRAPGSIGFDAEGVPLIQAANDYDAAFLLGYVHARDRLWQMDYLRRAASGTLAELVGSPALANDIQLRTLGLRRAAQSSWSATPDELRGQLRSYAEGVNLWVRNNPLPAEYGALELTRFEPWSPVDSLIVGKLLAFQLSFDLDIDYTVRLGAYMAAGSAAGFNGQALFFEDTHRVQPFDTRASISQSDFIAGASPELGKAAQSLPAYDAEFLAQTEALRDALLANEWVAPKLAPRENRGGSNWWLVHGENTASGKAILSNDPHLGLDLPAIMHEAHIISTDSRYPEPMNVAGLAPPGAPSILLGCTPKFCWGLTTNPMDVSDTYQEKFVLNTYGLPTHTLYKGVAEPVNWTFQSYYVNRLDGVADNAARENSIGYTNGGLTITIPRRNHGPVLSITNDTGISVAYTGWGATRELEAIRRINRATGLEDFQGALSYFDVGSQNFGYAGTDGTIAYFTTAEAPVREDLQANTVDGVPPFLIRDGSGARKNEWLPVTHPQANQATPYEILPPEEMPSIINPASGYIANANNDPIGSTFDNNAFNQLRPGGGLHYLSFGYSSLRQGRIDRELQSLIGSATPITPAHMKQLQANTELLDAELVFPYLDAAFHNAHASSWPELHALATDERIDEAIKRLQDWDYSSPTGLTQGFDAGDNPAAMVAPTPEEVANSVAATIWALWRGQAVRNTVDATLSRVGLGSYLPGSNESYIALKRLLERYDAQQGRGISGLNFFQVTGAPNASAARDYLLLKSLSDALDLAASPAFAAAFGGSTHQDDYRWGKLHRIVFDHALGGPFNIPGPGLYGLTNLSSELQGVARQGGYEAVDASSHSSRANSVNGFMFGSGPARRFVGEMSTPIVADQIYPGGQSGVLGSPAYISQLPRWLVNAYKPLPIDQTAHQAAVLSTINFVPAGSP